MQALKSHKDILAGLAFIGCALAFGIAAAGYPIGTAVRMGPGYFPLLLAGALGALGLAILVRGLLVERPDDDLGIFAWRGLLLLPLALIFFGATIRGLGLGPSLFVTVFLSAMASPRNSLAGAALIAAALTLLCILIFITGLGVALPIVGPWLRF